MRSLALLLVYAGASLALQTFSPTTSPTTLAPTTREPTTHKPTTAHPSHSPTTSSPTASHAPTTSSPTSPTTLMPTYSPTTPTTFSPTESPTTHAPTAPTAAINQCAKALFRVANLSYVNPTVSLAMLGASSETLNYIGDYEACMHICDAKNHKCTGNVATHCTVTLGVFAQGICVPTNECTEEAFQALLDSNIPFPKHNFTLKGWKAHCGSYQESHLSAGAIVMIIVLLLLVVLVAAGTYLDVQAAAPPAVVLVMENKAGTASVSSEVPLLPKAKEKEHSVGTKLLLAFSLSSSVASLLERSPTRKYKSLDGIRALSLMWIILGHTLNFFMFVGISNGAEFYPPTGFTSKWSFSVFIFGAGNAVDTFFFLSAFLATLVMIRRLEKGGAVPIFGSVIHRFLRLTPAYFFVIMTYMSLGPYMGEGPFWFNMRAGNVEPCHRYWWTNLLYINNFYPKVYADQCVPWTWYLANDMQFFIVGVIITVVFHNRFKWATAILTLLSLTSFVITAFIVADNEIQSFSLTNPAQYQNDVYDKPYTRIPSYLIGMWVAFLFTKTNVRIKGKFWISVCVALVFICTFVPCYVFHGEFYPTLSSWNVTQNVLYLTLARPMWTTGIALLTYLCICDVGGFFDWFLSLGLWDPMAKLSYSAYLVHPIVMRVFYFNKRTLFTWSIWEYTTYFVSNLFISYAVAMVVYCFVETPFANLEKVVGDLGKRGKRERR